MDEKLIWGLNTIWTKKNIFFVVFNFRRPNPKKCRKKADPDPQSPNLFAVFIVSVGLIITWAGAGTGTGWVGIGSVRLWTQTKVLANAYILIIYLIIVF